MCVWRCLATGAVTVASSPGRVTTVSTSDDSLLPTQWITKLQVLLSSYRLSFSSNSVTTFDAYSPCVFRSSLRLAADWGVASWTPSTFDNTNPLSCSIVKVRFYRRPCECDEGSRDFAPDVRETACYHLHVSLADFCDWLESNDETQPSTIPFSQSQYWAYCDYQYVADIFRSLGSRDLTNWDSVFEPGATDASADEGVKVDESAFWFGSQYAHTACHQDVYGYNLHLQVYGCKTWTLLPPRAAVPPLRVPYEESSVFTSVESMAELRAIPGCLSVTLNPGDILFIPHQWWHRVHCDSLSCISVNRWFPLLSDEVDRAKEAIVRVVATGLLDHFPSCIADASSPGDDSLPSNPLINPTETSIDQQENHTLLHGAMASICDGVSAVSEAQLAKTLVNVLVTEPVLSQILMEVKCKFMAPATLRNEESRPFSPAEEAGGPWYAVHRQKLLDMVAMRRSSNPLSSSISMRVIYPPLILQALSTAFSQLPSPAMVWYSVHHCRHPSVIQRVWRRAQSISASRLGWQCISVADVTMIRISLGSDVPILFSPGLCALPDYEVVFGLNDDHILVVVDHVDVLTSFPSLFHRRRIVLGLSIDTVLGCHSTLIPAYHHSRMLVSEAEWFCSVARQLDCLVVGVDCLTHHGVESPQQHWRHVVKALSPLLAASPDMTLIIRNVDDSGRSTSICNNRDIKHYLQMVMATAPSVAHCRIGVVMGAQLVEEAMAVLTTVTQIRRWNKIHSQEGNKRRSEVQAWVGIDPGITRFCDRIEDRHPIIHLSSTNSIAPFQTCHLLSQSTVLCQHRLLPATVAIDDVLLVLACGYSEGSAPTVDIASDTSLISILDE